MPNPSGSHVGVKRLASLDANYIERFVDLEWQAIVEVMLRPKAGLDREQSFVVDLAWTRLCFVIGEPRSVLKRMLHKQSMSLLNRAARSAWKHAIAQAKQKIKEHRLVRETEGATSLKIQLQRQSVMRDCTALIEAVKCAEPWPVESQGEEFAKRWLHHPDLVRRYLPELMAALCLRPQPIGASAASSVGNEPVQALAPVAPSWPSPQSNEGAEPVTSVATAGGRTFKSISGLSDATASTKSGKAILPVSELKDKKFPAVLSIRDAHDEVFTQTWPRDENGSPVVLATGVSKPFLLQEKGKISAALKPHIGSMCCFVYWTMPKAMGSSGEVSS